LWPEEVEQGDGAGVKVGKNLKSSCQRQLGLETAAAINVTILNFKTHINCFFEN